MKRRVLTLSTQALSSRTVQPWTCRRCLAQSAIASTTTDDFIAPPAVPQQSHDIPNPATFFRTAIRPEIPSTRVHDDISSTASLDSLEGIKSELDTAEEADFEQQFLHDSLPSSKHEQRKALLEILKKDIRHDVPSQYLTHVHPGALTLKEKEQRRHLYKWAMTGHVNNEGEPKTDSAREIKGVVVSAGKMDRTVKVRIPGQRWEPRIKKYYATHTDHLVHDPNNSLLEGDIVILHKLSVAKTVRHVIGAVTVPYGTPLEQRPPIPTPEERLAGYKKRRFAKFARQGNSKKNIGPTAASSNTRRPQQATATQRMKSSGQKAVGNIAKHEKSSYEHS